MFCPFIKGDCEPECMYYDDGNDYDVEKCLIYNTIRSVHNTLNVDDNQDKMQKILSVLKNIENNTGNDNTDSVGIRTAIEEIKTLLSNRM